MWYFDQFMHRAGDATERGAKCNVKLTFEEGELLKAEVLK